MPKFTDEVLTRSKKGDVEIRWLVDRCAFVRYRHVDPETGEEKDGGKPKLVLMPESGDAQDFFLIPTKGGRFLIVKTEGKGERMIWDGGESRGTATTGNP